MEIRRLPRLAGPRSRLAGKAAFVDFVSPGQVNVQMPSGVAAGPQPVIVTTAGGSSVRVFRYGQHERAWFAGAAGLHSEGDAECGRAFFEHADLRAARRGGWSDDGEGQARRQHYAVRNRLRPGDAEHPGRPDCAGQQRASVVVADFLRGSSRPRRRTRDWHRAMWVSISSTWWCPTLPPAIRFRLRLHSEGRRVRRIL